MNQIFRTRLCAHGAAGTLLRRNHSNSVFHMNSVKAALFHTVAKSQAGIIANTPALIVHITCGTAWLALIGKSVRGNLRQAAAAGNKSNRLCYILRISSQYLADFLCRIVATRDTAVRARAFMHNTVRIIIAAEKPHTPQFKLGSTALTSSTFSSDGTAKIFEKTESSNPARTPSPIKIRTGVKILHNVIVFSSRFIRKCLLQCR